MSFAELIQKWLPDEQFGDFGEVRSKMEKVREDFRTHLIEELDQTNASEGAGGWKVQIEPEPCLVRGQEAGRQTPGKQGRYQYRNGKEEWQNVKNNELSNRFPGDALNHLQHFAAEIGELVKRQKALEELGDFEREFEIKLNALRSAGPYEGLRALAALQTFQKSCEPYLPGQIKSEVKTAEVQARERKALPPLRVENITIDCSGGIKWSPSPGAGTYKIYRSEKRDSAEGARVDTERAPLAVVSPPLLKFNDTLAELGKAYFYWIIASNDAGEGDSPIGPKQGIRTQPSPVGHVESHPPTPLTPPVSNEFWERAEQAARKGDMGAFTSLLQEGGSESSVKLHSYLLRATEVARNKQAPARSPELQPNAGSPPPHIPARHPENDSPSRTPSVSSTPSPSAPAGAPIQFPGQPAPSGNPAESPLKAAGNDFKQTASKIAKDAESAATIQDIQRIRSLINQLASSALPDFNDRREELQSAVERAEKRIGQLLASQIEKEAREASREKLPEVEGSLRETQEFFANSGDLFKNAETEINQTKKCHSIEDEVSRKAAEAKTQDEVDALLKYIGNAAKEIKGRPEFPRSLQKLLSPARQRIKDLEKSARPYLWLALVILSVAGGGLIVWQFRPPQKGSDVSAKTKTHINGGVAPPTGSPASTQTVEIVTLPKTEPSQTNPPVAPPGHGPSQPLADPPIPQNDGSPKVAETTNIPPIPISIQTPPPSPDPPSIPAPVLLSAESVKQLKNLSRMPGIEEPLLTALKKLPENDITNELTCGQFSNAIVAWWTQPIASSEKFSRIPVPGKLSRLIEQRPSPPTLDSNLVQSLKTLVSTRHLERESCANLLQAWNAAADALGNRAGITNWNILGASITPLLLKDFSAFLEKRAPATGAFASWPPVISEAKTNFPTADYELDSTLATNLARYVFYDHRQEVPLESRLQGLAANGLDELKTWRKEAMNIVPQYLPWPYTEKNFRSFGLDPKAVAASAESLVASGLLPARGQEDFDSESNRLSSELIFLKAKANAGGFSRNTLLMTDSNLVYRMEALNNKFNKTTLQILRDLEKALQVQDLSSFKQTRIRLNHLPGSTRGLATLKRDAAAAESQWPEIQKLYSEGDYAKLAAIKTGTPWLATTKLAEFFDRGEQESQAAENIHRLLKEKNFPQAKLEFNKLTEVIKAKAPFARLGEEITSGSGPSPEEALATVRAMSKRGAKIQARSYINDLEDKLKESGLLDSKWKAVIKDMRPYALDVF